MDIKKLIIEKIKYELGITKIERENESFHFLLNYCLDITKIPPTKDEDLRILQKCDALLLAIFDKLCQKYGLAYWLHWGTLLGAYRHKGFIPWDDDVDIAMPREDINKVIPLMKKDLNSYGISVEPSRMHPLRGLVLSYLEKEAGLWIDIFPLDVCTTNDEVNKIYSAMMTYRNFFWENKQMSEDQLMKKKTEILSTCPNGNIKYYLPAMEVRKGVTECTAYLDSDIFPLKKMKFEEYELSVPSKPHDFLRKSFGADYMNFPRHAINNHGQAESFANRAKANGIDMNEVYEYLRSIYDKLSMEI